MLRFELEALEYAFAPVRRSRPWAAREFVAHLRRRYPALRFPASGGGATTAAHLVLYRLHKAKVIRRRGRRLEARYTAHPDPDVAELRVWKRLGRSRDKDRPSVQRVHRLIHGRAR